MKALTQIAHSIQGLYLSEARRQQSFPERIFYWLLTISLSFIFIWSVINTPELRAPARLIPFTVLMIVHIALHWLSSRLYKRQRDLIIYLLVQGLLAFTLTWIGGGVGVLLGLYMALIGEATGMLNRHRLFWPMIIFYLAISSLNFVLLFGWSSLFWWVLAVIPTTVFVMIYVMLYNRQAEARDQAQTLLADLEAANSQLTEYADRVEDLTIANERQRMARELHDTLSQGLAGLILQLEAADAHLAGGRSERAHAIIQQTMLGARAALADARRAIDDLRQGSPEPADMESALRQEVERFTHATGIDCQLSMQAKAQAPEHLSEPLLRAAAEGLTNAARHAHAQKVQVRYFEMDGCLVLEVCDDGCGFDPAAPVASGHYGLLGMRERARMAGGELAIQSGPGNGTYLTMRLPLKG